MNPASVNLVMLVGTAAMVTAAAFGASGLRPDKGPPPRTARPPLTLSTETWVPDDEVAALKETGEFWSNLAQEKIPDKPGWESFGEFWNGLTEIRKSHADDFAQLPDTKAAFIKGVVEDGMTEKWRTSLLGHGEQDAGEMDDLAEKLHAYLADDHQGPTLARFSKSATDALDSLLDDLKLPQFKLEENHLRLAGREFAWIKTPDLAFWISRDEIEIGDFDALAKKIRDSELFGSPYEIRRPTESEWLAARTWLNGEPGFNETRFDGGRGEELSDGSIIGSADDFTKSRLPAVMLKALSRSNRQQETAIRIPAKTSPKVGGIGAPIAAADGKKTAQPSNGTTQSPETRIEEQDFVSRIVILSGQ